MKAMLLILILIIPFIVGCGGGGSNTIINPPPAIPEIKGIVQISQNIDQPMVAIATLGEDGSYSAVSVYKVELPAGDRPTELSFTIKCPTVSSSDVKYYFISFDDKNKDGKFQQEEYTGECNILLIYQMDIWKLVDKFGTILAEDATKCDPSTIKIELQYP